MSALVLIGPTCIQASTSSEAFHLPRPANGSTYAGSCVYLKISDQRHRTCSSIVLKEESGSATLASEGIVAVCGWRKCPLDLFVRGLKQKKKDEAHRKDNDVMEVVNGEISCPALWSTQ